MARAKKKIEAEAAPAPSVLARLRERLSLPGLESWSTNVRTVLLNLVFLVIVIVLVPLLVGQFRREQVIIEPIGVPEALSARGLTDNVAASRIWDGLRDVALAAKTSKDSISALPDSRRVEFSFPDSGLSIESLVFHLRRLFNAHETRIAGEFVCAAADCAADGLRLRLRIIRDGVDLVDLPPMGETPERDYFADAASGILAVLDPFVAIAAAAEKEPLKATILAHRLVRSHHRDAHWAYNLIGNIRSTAGDHSGAIEAYRAALDLQPDFVVARANLGNALRLAGDLQGAKSEFARVFDTKPDDAFALEGSADLALAEGNAKEAVRLLMKAAAADPVEPRYLARAGKVEMDAGNDAEARRHLAQALELDPGYLPAFAFLAALELAREDYAAAEKIYRNAADYAPDDAGAQASHAGLLAVLKRWDEAIERYGRAVALAPHNAEYRLKTAKMLQMAGRHDEALAALAEAERLAPDNGEIFLAKGDSLRNAGRKPEAVAAYRRFLDLDRESVMRPLAERFIALLSE